MLLDSFQRVTHFSCCLVNRTSLFAQSRSPCFFKKPNRFPVSVLQTRTLSPFLVEHPGTIRVELYSWKKKKDDAKVCLGRTASPSSGRGANQSLQHTCEPSVASEVIRTVLIDELTADAETRTPLRRYDTRPSAKMSNFLEWSLASI